MINSLVIISSLLLVFSSIALGDTSLDRILSVMESGEFSTWTPGPRVLSYHSTSTLPFSGDQMSTQKAVFTR